MRKNIDILYMRVIIVSRRVILLLEDTNEECGCNHAFEKRFPDDIHSKIPNGAKEERIKCYRACKTNDVDTESFIPSYVEWNYIFPKPELKDDPSAYALSLYERFKDIKRFSAVNVNCKKPYKIAVGYTEPCCGLSQRTKERTGKKTSHIDWWLFDDAKPHEHFKIINDLETWCKYNK